MSAVAPENGSQNISKGSSGKKSKKEKPLVSQQTPPPPDSSVHAAGSQAGDDKVNGAEGVNESPYIRELQKQIRNVNKKLTAMHKVDAIIAENPKLTLDDLVAMKKINNDQKAQALNKHSLQTKLAQLEEQITQFRKFEEESQQRWAVEKEKIESRHAQELESLKGTSRSDTEAAAGQKLKQQLLVLSKFLSSAAARRQAEEDDSDEAKAFEGMLLLLYAGDESAVEAAEKLITGSSENVPATDGTILPVTFEQVKQQSLAFAPYAAEERWADDVVRAESPFIDTAESGGFPSTDPTIANAGLTEIDAQTNVAHGAEPDAEQKITPNQGDIDSDAANAAAAQQWDTNASSGEDLNNSWVSVPRPADETETGETPYASNMTQRWADEVPTETVSTSTANGNDGFREVHHGRGGRGRGEFRGAGRGRGGPRGGGEGNGHRGRGGYRGDRGNDGGFRGRGRGGRGGPRGRGEA